jgi:hypothetical protein
MTVDGKEDAKKGGNDEEEGKPAKKKRAPEPTFVQHLQPHSYHHRPGKHMQLRSLPGVPLYPARVAPYGVIMLADLTLSKDEDEDELGAGTTPAQDNKADRPESLSGCHRAIRAILMPALVKTRQLQLLIVILWSRRRMLLW